MNTAARLAVLSCLLAMPIISRAATLIVWQGDAAITAASLPCFSNANERANIRAGDVLRSVVRPGLLADNGNDSRVAFIKSAHAEFALDLAGGLTIAGPGTYSAFGVTSSGRFRTNVGGTYQNFSLKPATPAPTDAFLTLTGTVNDFMFIPNCTVSFRAAYVLRP